jgi:hypothetical protein
MKVVKATEKPAHPGLDLFLIVTEKSGQRFKCFGYLDPMGGFGHKQIFRTNRGWYPIDQVEWVDESETPTPEAEGREDKDTFMERFNSQKSTEYLENLNKLADELLDKLKKPTPLPPERWATDEDMCIAYNSGTVDAQLKKIVKSAVWLTDYKQKKA